MCSVLQSDVFLYIGVRVLWAHWHGLHEWDLRGGAGRARSPLQSWLSSRDQAWAQGVRDTGRSRRTKPTLSVFSVFAFNSVNKGWCDTPRPLRPHTHTTIKSFSFARVGGMHKENKHLKPLGNFLYVQFKTNKLGEQGVQIRTSYFLNVYSPLDSVCGKP